MSCLDNYIGIYGHCGSSEPASGLYINKHLAGITLRRAANYADGELPTGVDVLNQAIENGIQRARSELITEMLSVVRFNAIISTGRYGIMPIDYTDSSSYLPVTAANRGVKLQLNNNCRLSSIYIKSIDVLTNNSGAANITITDGGNVVTKQVTLQPQIATSVNIDYKASSNTVLITMDNSALSVADTSLNYTNNTGCCANDCCGGDCDCRAGMNVYGWDGVRASGNTYGISVLADVICDEDKFICEISHIPDVAWMSLYAAGIWAFEYGLLSNRINAYTNYGKEQVSLQIEQWEQAFSKRKEKVVKQLPGYLASIDSCCIECNASNWYVSVP